MDTPEAMERLKEHLPFFIDYYYTVLENPTGGLLHIVLDDGNIEHGNIHYCMEECEKEGDTFGYFLGNLMRYFEEEELQKMYDNGWKF